MSRIGNKPITIPPEVKVEIKNHEIKIAGPLGWLEYSLPAKLTIAQKDASLTISRSADDRISRSLHGLWRQIIANAFFGVVNRFSKKLEIKGIGFRAEINSGDLVLSLGYSHPVKMPAPAGIEFQVEKNIITVRGIDKQLVGQAAANIRTLKKPDPYKGKGIRYQGEPIKLRPGKTAKAKEA